MKVVDLDKFTQKSSNKNKREYIKTEKIEKENLSIKSLFFADAVNYSKLKEEEFVKFDEIFWAMPSVEIRFFGLIPFLGTL